MLDDIIISLRIISLIKEGQKVSIHNGRLEIESRSRGIFAALRRWMNNDNRTTTVHYIRNIINNAIAIDDPKLHQVLQESLEGLNALSVTYSDDTVITATLKVLEEKIQSYIQQSIKITRFE